MIKSAQSHLHLDMNMDYSLISLENFIQTVSRMYESRSKLHIFPLQLFGRGGIVCILFITFVLLLSPKYSYSLRIPKVFRNRTSSLRNKISPKDRSISVISYDSVHMMKEKLNEVTSLIEERQAYLRQVLNDFSILGNGGKDDPNQINPIGEEEEEECHTIVIEHNGDKGSSDAKIISTTHFCFLVHGYRGNPADLLYLQSAMKNNVEEQVGKSLDTKLDEHVPHTRFVLHSSSSNYGKTSDGIENGGERLFQECDRIIRKYAASTSEGISNVTISFIGNSLGGLYSRYAVSKLVQRYQSESDVLIMNENIRLHLNVFVSTCTPHLGVAGLTYFTLPRIGEVWMGKMMEQTGLDIFRISGLIKKMCTEEMYLKPLSLFRKRVAYANAYQTDFVVSTESAAFLHLNSSYPHHFENPDLEDDNESNKETKSGKVVATLHTPRDEGKTNKNERYQNEYAHRKKGFLQSQEKAELESELLEMSNSMDKLGWKKVLVDLRNEMPMKLKIPRLSTASPQRQASGTLKSSEVVETFKDPSDDVIGFPLGHNTMVAVEKHRFSVLFKGGRPLMDDLAFEMVKEILKWNK